MSLISFDLFAPVYDRAKKLVFGDTLDFYQSIFLSQLPKKASHLIIGGGSGKLAEEVLNTCDPATLTLVDHSEKMLELSKQRIGTQANYLQDDIRDLQIDETFDFIHLPFVLDCLSESDLELVIERMGSLLNVDGHVIISDFSPQNKFQKLVVGLMYIFFYPFWPQPLLKVPQIMLGFAKNGFMPMAKRENESGFIFCSILTTTQTPPAISQRRVV